MVENKILLELDMQRNVLSGSMEELADGIRKAGDLRIYTEFRHNEHIDITSDNNEMIREVSDFPCTYLIEDRWVAGMMTLRQPVALPGEFGPRPSMSFFMYNGDGQQAIARPFLDGEGVIPVDTSDPGCDVTKFHAISRNGDDTIAPSNNFIYDFYSYKYMVQDGWEEVLSHDADGNVLSGSAAALDEASNKGYEIKVAIKGICNGLWGEENQLEHEMFIKTGPHYYYDQTGYMVVETRPFVRCKPAIPMEYEYKNWDFGWAIVRSDGHVAGLYYDPYTLKPQKTFSRHDIRWFVRKY